MGATTSVSIQLATTAAATSDAPTLGTLHAPTMSQPSSKSSAPVLPPLAKPTASDLGRRGALLAPCVPAGALLDARSSSIRETHPTWAASHQPQQHQRAFSFSSTSLRPLNASTAHSSRLDLTFAEQQHKVSLIGSSVFGTLSLPPAALLALAQCAQLVSFTKGEYLFRQGDVADSFMVIASRGATVAVDGALLSPTTATSSPGTSPGGSSRRLLPRGSLSPPIASSGFAAASARLRVAGMRRASEPLPLTGSRPQPLTSIRECPVAPIAVRSNLDRFEETPPVQPEEDKHTVGIVAPHVPSLHVAIISPTAASISSCSSSSSSSSPPSVVNNGEGKLLKSFGDVIGCEGLGQAMGFSEANVLSKADSASTARRSYSARVHSIEGADVLLVTYSDFRTHVWSLLSSVPSATPLLGDALVKLLATKELEGVPVRATPVPTLASVLSAQREEEAAAAADESADTTSVATRPRSLSSPCRYTDVDLLLHPLFQKVFYVFCQVETTHELLEFWRDCVNFRSGFNRHQLGMAEEARILQRAYILPTAKKFQRHLTAEVQESITQQAASIAQAGDSTVSGAHRLTFLEAERVTEAMLIKGSLRSFKLTPAFTKILPFVRLDPKARAKNAEARRSLERGAFIDAPALSATAATAQRSPASATVAAAAAKSPPRSR